MIKRMIKFRCVVSASLSLLSSIHQAAAFEPVSYRNASSLCHPSTALCMTANSRRQLLASAFATASLLTMAAPASATYSAFSHREDDWKQRVDNGQVQFSSARQLKMQLREIAPMNSESSRIFCPNGTPSAVSPLMENKCGDQLALPSVYGRTSDAVGNSIPGFAGRLSGPTSGRGAGGTNIGLSVTDVGGFPAYK
jgi:hypothetical protein